ncbi:DUF262 domain-containing protein [Micromonospora sp. NPDC049903]|uniref:DUF262 domain-containing protein n=1 Tax=Micromonospora sp. NPDC049903 TaxID=3364276 RepID=UPI00378F9B82
MIEVEHVSDATEEIVEELDSLGHLTGVEVEDESDGAGSGPEDLIRMPFDPELIDVITKNTTVDLLLSRVRTRRVDLQPDFQRRAGIWRNQAKSRLIESLLLRIPLPTFYAAETDDEAWAMVDGIQRLTTIVEFVEPEAIDAEPLRLRDLEYLGKDYDQATFADLPGRLQTRLRETELIVHLIRKGTPEEVKFNIFARINTGGLPLSRQELRHALIPGEGRQILREWADSEAFKAATGNGVRSDRMADREMILRFLAFRLANPWSYTEDDFDAFLRSSMRALNELSAEEVDELWEQFERALHGAYEIFGEYAFRKVDRKGGSRRMPINKALFESVAVSLADLSESEIAVLVRRYRRVEKKFLELMSDVDFQAAISQGTGDPAKIRFRFDAIRRLFASAAE